MKCKYKEPMECFYLTKDNFDEFLEKFYYLYKKYDYIIKYQTDNCITIKPNYYSFSHSFYFNYYYVNTNEYDYDLECYTKEEFEERFEVVEK